MAGSAGQSAAQPLRSSLRRSDFLRATRLGRRYSTAHFLVFVLDRRGAPRPERQRRGHGQPREGSAPAEDGAAGSRVIPAEARAIDGVPGGGSPRLGVTVTRKVGKAVRRNRIKRLAREWFRAASRTFGHGLEACDIILIANRNIPSDLGLRDLMRDLDPVMEKWACSRGS